MNIDHGRDLCSYGGKVDGTMPHLSPRLSKTNIMVFGTFDLLHKGHEYFFRQARKLAKTPRLIVSVARDINVKKIKKLGPLYSERQRLGAVARHPLVDLAVLGGLRNHLSHIVREKPAIIALGYDQNNYVDGLRESLAKKSLVVRIVRLKPYKPHLYKSSILKKQL